MRNGRRRLDSTVIGQMLSGYIAKFSTLADAFQRADAATEEHVGESSATTRASIVQATVPDLTDPID